MWVFNEGVPRSGKSYDCVKNHVLPAIKAGRHVWARINGLETAQCREAIAAHLSLPLEHVEKYLHHVETKDVVSTFRAQQDPATGRWLIGDDFKDSLVIIDEIHEFYVDSRQPLDPAIEQFFALFGQNGGDGIMMTQMFKRLHDAMRGRVERKHSFQKLTAFGMDGKYRVTFHHSISAGKFQKIGSKVLSYDKAIFPLYHGYAPGSKNTEVYKEGSTNVWRLVIVGAVIALAVGAGAVFMVVRFFKNPENLIKPEARHSAAAAAAAPPSVVGQVYKPGEVIDVVPVAPVVKPDPYADLGSEQRYVAQLADRGRVRLSALAQVGGVDRAWVEWVDSGNNVIEQLDLDQLRDLGFSVNVESYGVRMQAGTHVIVATAWPRQPSLREPEARTYNTREAGLVAGGGAGARVSAQSHAAGDVPSPAGVVIGHSPGKRVDVFPRNPAAAISSYTGPTSTL